MNLKASLTYPFGYPARNPAYWLILTPGILLMGAAAGNLSISPELIAALLTASYPAAFITFAVNDVYDEATDEHNDRSLIRDDHITPGDDNRVVWGWTAAFAGLCLAPAAWHGEPETITLAIGLLTATIAYSAPPLRLKTNPVLSAVLAAVGGWMLYAYGYSYTADLTTIPARSFLYGVLAHTGVTLGAIPDIEADKQAGITTFPIAFGEQTTVLTALIAVLAAIASGLIHGVLLYFLIAYAAALTSMLFNQAYIAHFKAVLTVGFIALAILILRVLTGL